MCSLSRLSEKRGHGHADMKNADMENADIETADMENADMENADKENADKHILYGENEKFRVSFKY